MLVSQVKVSVFLCFFVFLLVLRSQTSSPPLPPPQAERPWGHAFTPFISNTYVEKGAVLKWAVWLTLAANLCLNIHKCGLPVVLGEASSPHQTTSASAHV